VEVERTFPAEPIRPLTAWTFPEYLEQIRPRLERPAASEAEPKLIPHLFEYWGGEPPVESGD
jgi:hypothetical protein